MGQPIITLTTDFGASDHYVGAMKGVILGICARTQIVDICHEVPPFAIEEGAFTIAQAYACFPKKTVNVVVVDPGVGSARRPILVEAAGQFFIGPDNGVFAMIYARQKHRVRLIANERYFRKPVSATFHGRDIFAPVAAHIAAGVAPRLIGPPIHDFVQGEFRTDARNGRVLKIDRFGNIVTSFFAADFAPDFSNAPFSLTIGRRKITSRARTYAETSPGKLFLIEGSSGYLEISMNQGSAAEQLGVGVGAPVKLTQ